MALRLWIRRARDSDAEDFNSRSRYGSPVLSFTRCWFDCLGVSYVHFVKSARLLIFDRYAEENIGIIAACIPCLKSLLEKFFRALGGHVSNTMTKGISPFGTIGGMSVSVQGGSRSPRMRSSRVSKRLSELQDMSLSLDSGDKSFSKNGTALPEVRDLEAATIVKEVEISWSEESGNT